LLSLLESASVIVNAIHEDKLDNELLEAIKQGNTAIDFIEGLEGVHAEMKIAEKIFETCSSSEEVKSTKVYIGISKLTCAPCYIAIKALLKKEGLEIKV